MLVLRTQVVTVCTVVFGYWKDVQDNGLDFMSPVGRALGDQPGQVACPPGSGSDPAAPMAASPSPQPMPWDPAIVCRTAYGEARKAR